MTRPLEDRAGGDTRSPPAASWRTRKMLVLRRKPEERIVIATPAGPISITVTRIERRSVQLGIHAPTRCQVLREELVTQEPSHANHD